MFEHFRGNPPIDVGVVQTFEATSGIHLRKDYTEFLARFNGGEGFIGHGYASLWSLEDLLRTNNEYRVSEFAPELLLFGSDGGGEAFAFDLRTEPNMIVRVPFIPLSIDEAKLVARDFAGFIRYLSQIDAR